MYGWNIEIGVINNLGLTKMDAILQTIVSWIKQWICMFEFWMKFHCNIIIGVQLVISQNWFRNDLVLPGNKPLPKPMWTTIYNLV